MAVTNAVGALYAARFEQNFYDMSRWVGLTVNHSSETPYGDELVVNRDATNVTVQDYTAGTDLTVETRFDTGAVTLALNQRKYYNIYVDDTESAQVRPSIVNEATLNAAAKMATEVDAYIRGQAIVGLGADRMLTDIKAGATFDDIKDTPTEAVRNAIVDRITDAAELADELYWPESGRVMVISTKVKRAIIDYLLTNKFTFSGNINDSTYQNFAIANTLGFMPVVDPTIPKTGNDAFRLYFMLRNNGLGYAQQLSVQETIRAEKRFGDNLRRLMMYGAARTHPDKLLTVKVDPSA